MPEGSSTKEVESQTREELSSTIGLYSKMIVRTRIIGNKRTVCHREMSFEQSSRSCTVHVLRQLSMGQ